MMRSEEEVRELLGYLSSLYLYAPADPSAALTEEERGELGMEIKLLAWVVKEPMGDQFEEMIKGVRPKPSRACKAARKKRQRGLRRQ